MRSEKVTPINRASLGNRIQPAECEKHGAFEQKVTMLMGKALRSHCPECTRIASEQREAKAQAEQAVNLRMALSRKLGDSLIPKRFADRSLANYLVQNKGQAEALRFCRHYVKTFDQIADTGRCMVLLGKPGTGKTHLGAGMANDLMRNTSHSAVYRTVGSILQAIRATYDRSSEATEATILASLIDPSLLVLDEVGVSKEQPSDFELTTLFAIINGRYEQVKPTVVISNLDGPQLPMAMGERCVDRLREGGMIVVPFEWDSYRGKEASHG
ncbi:ATP-binding protein [Pseudomonas fulva]|uniref:ATP-binding protein n=1 Tax=Pseudomonas fulva TaxID=47880 RepID=UPI0018AB0D9A|nr:ATP-binding protein [Pseudomonas fulva]MBF8636054.1 ATP-binding protein [Pseudomonas fulva]MBF8688093.1 ATP-binding protein [Pseudomonas fulva]